MEKYTKEQVEMAHIMSMATNDTANWSYDEYIIRVRFNPEHITTSLKTEPLSVILCSNTKAKRIHGYLEGDYKIATGGLYFNGLSNLSKIIKRYPDLIQTFQTLSQYRYAKVLSDAMVNEYE